MSNEKPVNATQQDAGLLELRNVSDFLRHQQSAVTAPNIITGQLNSTSYPWAVGGDSGIDSCLNNQDPPPGCWVDGETVHGDIYIKTQGWGTYTRPIFAYLKYVNTYTHPSGASQHYTTTQSVGLTETFTKEVKASYSVGANIDIVNASSSIETGFSKSSSWSQQTLQGWTTTLRGPATFYIYQVALVYAHCATMAGKSCASSFKYQRTRVINDWRTDLYYLSAISKKDMVILGRPLIPLSWDQVQQYVLIDNWNTWYFDYSAYGDPFRRY
ncbi:monalysin family beta-barrel pore-forming toxin [Cystobacter fuscus]|uniref:monalysin family beta-barrel pore-forming toxin n=1 Tax=Cystobacter fuscus TaxID=43 RepID=UPI002B2D0DDD|nr:monalysin family beta-barrel pore-forming toxin [Cystobacter fuscus]